MKVFYPLLIVVAACLGGCKKNSDLNSLDQVVLKREGLLRVECNNCEVNYRVNNRDYRVGIDQGSNDMPFYYSGEVNLITEVVSKESQNIRLLVMDSFGRVVANELNEWSAGESRKKTFLINIK